MFEELDLTIFVNTYHRHDKVTGSSITVILSVFRSTPTTCNSKRQTSVHTSTFRAELTAFKTAVYEAVMLR